jgi:hypothetical protein
MQGRMQQTFHFTATRNSEFETNVGRCGRSSPTWYLLITYVRSAMPKIPMVNDYSNNETASNCIAANINRLKFYALSRESKVNPML